MNQKTDSYFSIAKSVYPNGYIAPSDGYVQASNNASNTGTWLYLSIYNGNDTTVTLASVTYRTLMGPYSSISPIFVKKGMRIVDTSDLNAYVVRFVPLIPK